MLLSAERKLDDEIAVMKYIAHYSPPSIGKWHFLSGSVV